MHGVPGPEGRPAREVEPLLDHLDAVARALEDAGRWSLLLDLDGTLAPIVERPELARVPGSTIALLRGLASRPDGMVAIITGRSIDDARALIRLDELYYAGNHGLEIAGPAGVRFREPTAHALADRLRKRGFMLSRHLDDMEGAVVECKGLTASVHYRLVDPARWEAVSGVVRAVVPLDDPDFAVHAGKCVHEIRPRVAWGKGRAAAWLLDRLGRSGDVAFFLGDDVTDEDAFRELHGRGITARVGPFTKTLARYRIPGPQEVGTFLEWLARRLGPDVPGPGAGRGARSTPAGGDDER